MVLCLEREKGRSCWTASDVLEMKLHCWTVWIRVRLGHMTVSMDKMLESYVMVSIVKLCVVYASHVRYVPCHPYTLDHASNDSFYTPFANMITTYSTYYACKVYRTRAIYGRNAENEPV